MHLLTIRFQSIQFNKDIIREDDKIRVSIISFPCNNKQTFIIDPKKMNDINNFLDFDIDDQFKKIVFIFEKKSFFKMNPLIATKSINLKNIPDSPLDLKNTEIKTFDIYKPIRCQSDVSDQNSRVVGKMTVQFFISQKISNKNNNSPYNISKIHNGEGYSKVQSSFMSEYDKEENNLMLLDDDLII